MNVGEFCSVIFLFFVAPQITWIYFEFTHAIKCIKKGNFTWGTRNVLLNCKKNSVKRLNFKTKFLDNIPK